jgi:tripartite-type tricarboxylate transporter receptor subunit TctC
MKKLFFISLIMAILMKSAVSAPVPTVPSELQDRIITVIIPYTPGGDTDATQRFVVEQVSRISGLKFVIVNKGGASGIVGTREFIKARPDGLTIMGHANETFALNPILFKEQAVNMREVQPVAIHAFTPQFIYTGFNNSIQNHNDIITAATNNPKFTVGCNVLHQCMYIGQYLNHYNIKPYIVMYKTPADMAVAAFNGDIDIFGAGAVSGSPFVQGGRIRAVAATWDHKLDVYPNAAALGTIIPGYRANNLQMVSVPAGTPKHIVEFYNQIFRLAVQTPASVERFQDLSVIAANLDIDQVRQALDKELQIIKDSQQFAPKQ